MADPNRDLIGESHITVLPKEVFVNNLKENTAAAAEKVGSTITNIYTTTVGAAANWKLILIGALALVVLLKD